jgi:hypothetical protein
MALAFPLEWPEGLDTKYRLKLAYTLQPGGGGGAAEVITIDVYPVQLQPLRFKCIFGCAPRRADMFSRSTLHSHSKTCDKVRGDIEEVGAYHVVRSREPVPPGTPASRPSTVNSGAGDHG